MPKTIPETQQVLKILEAGEENQGGGEQRKEEEGGENNCNLLSFR